VRPFLLVGPGGDLPLLPALALVVVLALALWRAPPPWVPRHTWLLWLAVAGLYALPAWRLWRAWRLGPAAVPVGR